MAGIRAYRCNQADGSEPDTWSGRCIHPECAPGRHTITFTADNSTLERQLRIVAKHATACAEELAAMGTAPTGYGPLTSDDGPMRG